MRNQSSKSQKLNELSKNYCLAGTFTHRTAVRLRCRRPAGGENPVLHSSGGSGRGCADYGRDEESEDNRIIEAEPDLVITNREENQKEDVEQLADSLNVMVTDISSIDDALIAIYDIGKTCGAADKAENLISNIRAELDSVPDEQPQSVAYFIWREPWMTVGNDTYIHSVLSHWNLENVYQKQSRYPKTTLKELGKKSPDLILLSNEPFPFKEKHREEVEEASPGSRVLMVDGEWFSWYGSRMLPAFKRLNSFRKAIS